jgi:uncharacterized protein (TIGR03066 family)
MPFPGTPDRLILDNLLETNMKAKLAIVALACVALTVSACGGSSPRALIVGRWEAGQEGIKVTAEFAKDGTAKLTMFGQTLRGTYKLDGDELEWTLNGQATRSKVKVTATELELTSDGRTVTYKRL